MFGYIMLFANQTRLIIGCPNNCIGIASYSSSTWTWFAYFGLLGASIGALFHFNTSGYFFFECMKSISLQLSVLFLFLSWAESTYEKQGSVNTTLQLQNILKYAVNEIICATSFFFFTFRFFFFLSALMRIAGSLKCSIYTFSDALHSQEGCVSRTCNKKTIFLPTEQAPCSYRRYFFTYFYFLVNLMVIARVNLAEVFFSLSLSLCSPNQCFVG